MRDYLLFLFLLIPSLCYGDVYSIWKQADDISPDVQAKTVQGLISRLVGNSINAKVVIDGQRQDGGRDQVSVEYSHQGQLDITASTGVAAAWGLHHFLKYRCNSHVSWEHVRVAISDCQPNSSINLQANDLYRYYQNVCTPGYSFVWWDWNDWERHIDWMALNGINLPLAFNGQEEIWRRVWIQLGVDQSELDSYFGGPAFLPWARMGNLRGWGGPLTRNWHKQQIQLQHRILDRMRSFGMLPVLPGFAGQVPPGFARLHPNSSFTTEANWNGFQPEYSGIRVLDPMDPLFTRVGKLFLEEQTKEFGSNHLYNCDTYNEMEPPSKNLTFLASLTKSVYAAMAAADSDAVWVMQGWLFLDDSFWGDDQIKSFLTAVEPGKMLLLDLDSTDREQYTRTKSYYGQPFIFNMIHTFGGQLAMFGRTDNINARPFQARSMEKSSMVGTGFAPEGIHNSYIMYDLLSEMSWRREPITDLDKWFGDYATRRYGKFDQHATQAWNILRKNVYNSQTRNFHGHVLVIRNPGPHMKDIRWYNMSEILEPWSLFISASDHLHNQETFQYDLVDVTRQALVNLAPMWFDLAKNAYDKKDILGIHENSMIFIQLLEDLEEILATNYNFLLGPWLESAKQLGSNDWERQNYEYNARNQITLWGPDGEILDYGGKQWSGLMTDYYIPRWRLFFKSLEAAVLNNTSFNQDEFNRESLERIGKPFCLSRQLFPVQPRGKTIPLARTIWRRWTNNFSKLDGNK